MCVFRQSVIYVVYLLPIALLLALGSMTTGQLRLRLQLSLLLLLLLSTSISSVLMMLRQSTVK